MLNQEFQESLKNLRNQYNLTQDELGKKIGVGGQTIYKYGITFPPPEKIESIHSFFEVDPSSLFDYRSKSENIDKLLKLIVMNQNCEVIYKVCFQKEMLKIFNIY
ncbi:helix-turn-helix transcriptional regulator [Listeria seeligeri]|uniref:helix-turn-helix domain-containing protein n=1 Tax=Listeria seeligeri TaxID=1640 RepID=UPI0016257501|nr:helix-turn-helix transcriptional regulator [Listeria seeligeri]MBC1832468.1 helix-turn-helix transcriptional regulator [Listeria seeligeri]MBC1870096.1 helix-turn-helix transcriptional regulator [Listeria seeligeri]MBC1876675.1 helix-turn-helix transcriptional regulator [Listeria seeligeri]MBC2092041.1 helix-turn-helix transcriptional regulator [Listeria seeligeri]MBC6131100.1 helix-turn-helix transcriptional regulator [Listeria seeligeri]